MSDTTRTDAMARHARPSWKLDYYDMMDLARQLERENADWKDRANRVIKERDRLGRELAEVMNLLVSIRDAMVIQGSNQRITDWKAMIAAIDASQREKP